MFTAEVAFEAGEAIGIDWDAVEFDSATLAAGMEVELEHGSARGEEFNVTGDDPELTAMIAWVHLDESPLYYAVLASMEKQLEERTANYRYAYQIKLDEADTRLSPELQQYVKQYIEQLTNAVNEGASADDAFKKIQPDLDDKDANALINMLWENQVIGRRPLADLKDVLTYGDLFTGIQTLLERTIWEAAVKWWGTQETERAKEKDVGTEDAAPDEQGTKVERPKKPARDDTKTVELGASVLRFAGYRYEA